MATCRLETAAVERLHRQARADRWLLPVEAFAATLERSARKAFATAPPDPRELDRYLSSLHLEDLALACACAEGIESAWEHFLREYRPTLYRAADAIDPAGGARELADSLYGELFGLQQRDGERRSHFHYFHGRSSLATWLRAVLSQRHVDRVRSVRQIDPLPADDARDAIVSMTTPPDPAVVQYATLMREAIRLAVGRLAPHDRLRLTCYYAQDLTLSQIGRVLGEHEATVSRQLARARRAIREHVETYLRHERAMSEAAIAECFAAVIEDTGSLDVAELLASDEDRKGIGQDRSK
jgi:RNA polymerase sigma-70 factor (ECF subfamily)